MAKSRSVANIHRYYFFQTLGDPGPLSQRQFFTVNQDSLSITDITAHGDLRVTRKSLTLQEIYRRNFYPCEMSRYRGSFENTKNFNNTLLVRVSTILYCIR